MGAERSTAQKKNYFNAVQGKFVQRITEEQYNHERAESSSSVRMRKKKDGGIVYERIFDGISGYLKGYETRDTDFGTIEAMFILEDKGETYVVQFTKGSRPHKMVLQRFPNIDPSKKIFIGVFEGKVNDKEVMMAYVKYDGEKSTIQSAFPKDGDHNLPQLEKIKVKGKEVWDDTKQLEYFDNVVIPDMLSRINSKSTIKRHNTPEVPDNTFDNVPTESGVLVDDVDDDLPF
jgi:hypothetical protein